jgi:uncharacterized protein YrrD
MAAFDFRIGAQVHCTDGPGGQLAKLVADPQTQQVTELIVEKGFLFKKDRILPVSTVASATAQDIHLTIRSDELGEFAEYREVTVEEPVPETGGYRSMAGTGTAFGAYSAPHVPMVRKRLREGISAGKAVIDHKTDVESVEKALGQVDHVIAHGETNEITHLVMRRGIFPEYLVIPIEQIEAVDDVVLVRLSREELAALPRYQPGDAIHDETQGSEPGVVEANSPSWLGSADVAGQVNTALAMDPRTGNAGIDVINERGVIRLLGEVNNVETSRAAEAIAGTQPGVTSVQNELVVR